MSRSIPFLAVTIVFFLASSARAVDPSRHISQYRHSAWRTEDGYFRGLPRAITQTADGYLWIGTEAGLIRFDGVRLVAWVPPDRTRLPSLTITSLLAAHDGTLWIGTDAGLSHWASGRLVNYLQDQGQVNSIIEDRSGRVWIVRSRIPNGAEGPLCQIIGVRAECHALPDKASIGGCCGTLVEDLSGNLWMGSSTGLLRWRDGSFTVFPKKELLSSIASDGIDGLATTPGGSLWVGMDHGGQGLGLQEFAEGKWRPFHVRALDGEKLAITALFIDRDGALWIGTFDQGVYRVRATEVDHFSSANGLTSNTVIRFYQDREGNIWIASSKGIDSFQDLRIASFSSEEGLSEDSVVSVLGARDGTVWAGTGGALDAIRGGTISSIRKRDGLPGNQVTSLLEDHSGRLWVGVDDKLTIYRDGIFREIKRRDGTSIGTVAGLTEDTDNNVWATTIAPSRKLVRIRDFNIVEEISTLPAARPLAADRHSGIWVGLMNGDLARYRNGSMEVFAFKHNPNGRVRQVIVNADGSVLGATAVGLIGWKNGKLQTMNAKSGLPCDNVFAVLPHKGAFWLYTQWGLVEISEAQMQDWWRTPDLQLHLKVFDEFDGAQPGGAMFSPPASEAPDGKLWFATNSIVQRFDPDHITRNSFVPPVHVEQIVADRKSYIPDSNLALPPLMRDLEIHYTATSFVVPQKVHFRYKLEGRDPDWQDAGTRREAYYTDLAPRKYRFRVTAANSDGVWNEQGAGIDFSIAPAWFQTLWFRLSCVAAFVLLAWMAYRFRVKHIERQLNAGLEARVDERTRIARELHDTLLQGVLSAFMQLEAAVHQLPADSPGKPRFGRVLELMSQIAEEGRNAVRGFRSAITDSRNLEQAFSQLAQELALHNPIEFSVVVNGKHQPVNPAICDGIFWIGREALVNAFRHSQAGSIEVEIEYAAQHLRLRVRDNGKGINSEVLRSGRDGHWGLSGMRERAQRIGAEFNVWSRGDAGTEIELSVPNHIAVESEEQSWLARWYARIKPKHSYSTVESIEEIRTRTSRSENR